MQRRMMRGLAMAAVGVAGIFTLVTSGEAQTAPPISLPPGVTLPPGFTLPTFPTIPPPTMPPPTTTPPPTMPPSTTTPPPTMPPPTTTPPPTMPPQTIPPNIDNEISNIIQQLQGFGSDFQGLIDALQDIQARF